MDHRSRARTDFYEFTIAPLPGFAMDLSSLEFTERRSATGIGAFEIRTNLDGFATSVYTFDVPDNTANRRHTIPLGTRRDVVPWGLVDWWNYGGLTGSVWLEAAPPGQRRRTH